MLLILSVLLGLGAGIFFPDIFSSLSFLGDLFINLLKLFALPLIMGALTSAMGEIDHGFSELKKMTRNVVGYMLLSEVVAVTLALLLFNLFKPGVGLDPHLITQNSAEITASPESFTLSTFFLSIFPHNIFKSLSQFDLLPVVFFSIMFGLGISKTGEKGKPLLRFFQSLRDVSMTCLHGVMKVAPMGIFVLIGTGVSQSYASGNLKQTLMALLYFVLILSIGLFLHALWQLLLVIFLTKQNPFLILRESLPVFATAFGTSSSIATLPVAMDTAQTLKADSVTTRFMLPLCASINVGGMMMYEVAAALFFSQVLGYDLSLQQQIVIAIACILGGMAEGGIPETSMVSLLVVFKLVNIPLSAISILLPLDRLIDRLRTMVNIFGNMCGAIIVSNGPRILTKRR